MLAEQGNVEALLQNLQRQTFGDFEVYLCINNPASWASSEEPSERAMYADNQETLHFLEATRTNYAFRITVLDRQWTGKQRGVGWARKALFEAIAKQHDGNELIVSLDADTAFSADYLEKVLTAMNAHPDHSALGVPYYHPLGGDAATDRAMLRYELYMRHYHLMMLDIEARLAASRGAQSPAGIPFPYAFTALGSAMVFPLWAYRRVGGITPLQGGEDFYLMQKFAKTGKVLQQCDAVIFPQGRLSSRVPFGTGPAIAGGLEAMELAYPLYPHEGFEAVRDTYALFPDLYEHDIETPMSPFLRQQLRTDDLWGPLRKNFRSRHLFVHACAERADGLRILQFLKQWRQQQPSQRTAEEELTLFCRRHGIALPANLSFRLSPIADLDALRDSLFAMEQNAIARHS